MCGREGADGSALDGAGHKALFKVFLDEGVDDQHGGGGLTLLTNNSVLAGEDTYYASWTVGEPAPYTNADGNEVDLYPAQLYVLLYGCADQAAAESACAGFLAREQQTYTVHSQRTEEHNAQRYTVLDYTGGSAGNPYGRGSSAFAVRGNYVLVAELLAQDGFDGDVSRMLSAFLDGVHYSADL